MAAVLPQENILTLADLLKRLGGVPLDRIRFKPHPGTAVEQDVVDMHDRESRLFELVEGVLVEKPMGFLESRIAIALSYELEGYLRKHKLGIAAGADGMMRIAMGLVRMPDVSVLLWDRFPDRRIPTEPIPSLVPDLAVEVLSVSNTRAEMERKISEYFAAGCRCVWLVDLADKTVSVYDSPTEFKILSGNDNVTAESVIPGFHIAVSEVFERSGIE